MAVQITVGDLTFNGPWAPGTRWSLDIDAGWWDGPELDLDLLPTIHEGSAVGRVMVRHRTIVCSGVVETADTAALMVALADLEALVPVYESVPFVVHEPTGAMQVLVRAAPGNPRVRVHGDRVAEFQLTLIATDPHKTPFTPPAP